MQDEKRAVRAACPFLGLADDDRTRLLFPSPGHRCFSRQRKPVTVESAYQSSFCLTGAHALCPRFEKADHAPVVHVPRRAWTAPTPPSPTPAALPAAPVPEEVPTADPQALGRGRSRLFRIIGGLVLLVVVMAAAIAVWYLVREGLIFNTSGG